MNVIFGHVKGEWGHHGMHFFVYARHMYLLMGSRVSYVRY